MIHVIQQIIKGKTYIIDDTTGEIICEMLFAGDDNYKNTGLIIKSINKYLKNESWNQNT